jgi:threonine dehydrogenase-like Zn-dependent dehydrogenase
VIAYLGMARNMVAGIFSGVGKIVLEEVPVPEVESDQVLVRVRACGICQTDYSAYTGRRTNWSPPMIAGHEISGVVEKAGKDVNNWKEGDEVALSPVIHCGECYNCKVGREHYCIEGKVIGGEGQKVVVPGGFAEYVSVPTKVLYRKPPDVSFESAALAEPLAGSYKGLIEYTRLTIGEDIVIIGAGAMGLLVMMLAVAGGAGKVIVIDVSEWRLKRALELGATHAINAGGKGVKDQVYRMVPDGPDIVFEAAGVLDAARLSFEVCRRGTRINMFGVIIRGEIPISPADVHFLETRVDASFSVNPRVMAKSVELMKKKKVDPGKIVTHRFSLTRIKEAFDLMESQERIKIMIEP